MKKVTITFPVTPRKVWLAPKLEGFGAGYLNGYGGKLKDGESEVQAAIREANEEGHIIIMPRDLVKITEIDFFKLDEHIFKAYIFLATSWAGIPEATEEMGVPELFMRSDPPVNRMWKGDKLWIRQILIGLTIPPGGFVRYDGDMKEVIDWKLPDRG